MLDDGLPPLREIIQQFDLQAKKSLGQNFLFDLNLTRRIARSAAPLDQGVIVEIGPGPGGLTRALLMEGADNLIVVERDSRAMAALEMISAHYPGKLTAINDDALEINWQDVLKGRSAKVIANLPYNIGTQLLLNWLTPQNWPGPFRSFTLMFQKEVAARIVAAPGTEHYGRLSVLAQWSCVCKKLFDVNRSAFTPPPKITSSIVQLFPHEKRAGNCSAEDLAEVTAAAFGQRRKMLRSSLKPIFSDIVATLERLGINAEKRAEELTVHNFIQIAEVYKAQKSL